MEMEITSKEVYEEFYRKLDWDKIKINWNKNPIPMDLFLSFLTVKTERSREHLGSTNGWTKLLNKDLNLEISGGIVDGVEYLDNLQYGIKLHNPYNNYVNVFYMFDILNDDGKRFFLDYYKDDIKKSKDKIQSKIESLIIQLDSARNLQQQIETELKRITPLTNI